MKISRSKVMTENVRVNILLSATVFNWIFLILKYNTCFLLLYIFKNLLFYYESETSTRPSGIIFLEGCYCERLVSAPACIAPGSPLQTNNNSNANSSKTNKEEKLQVKCMYLFLSDYLIINLYRITFFQKLYM